MFHEFLNDTAMDIRDEYSSNRYHQVSANDTAVWSERGTGMRYRIYREKVEIIEIWNGFPVVYQYDIVTSSSLAFDEALLDVFIWDRHLLINVEIT